MTEHRKFPSEEKKEKKSGWGERESRRWGEQEINPGVHRQGHGGPERREDWGSQDEGRTRK
jgi:hypothetical protein